ncbi:MAG: hypothetical protein JW787_07330 [Sedimentisphaerales bacterium]|nr:hypothetical protein [Sedimentisphaerales bacterium]
MGKNIEQFENEINDLKIELEHFEQEKERVRAIIGRIGGVPQFRTTLVNILFVLIVITAGIISIFVEDLRLLMVELTTIMLSLKIIYMIHVQAKVNHFKFWILSAIELRVIEMMALLKQIKKQQEK